MNHKQATRKIKKGSRWTDGEQDVIIERVTTRDVYYKSADNKSSGICGVWYFRENYVPGRKGK